MLVALRTLVKTVLPSEALRMHGLLLSLVLCSASGTPSPYGTQPWLWYGSPMAPASSTVLSASGQARFTVLTASLLRLERKGPGQSFVDTQSLAMWNRATPRVAFNTSTAGAVTTIDTGALLLTYTDDGGPFSDANLAVLRRAPAFWSNASATWTPSQLPGSDAGNLLGTFHTLDSGHNGYGSGGLNCSLLSPDALGLDTIDFYPCDFGVISKSGFSLVDDSRTPVWDAASGWLQSRSGAVCESNSSQQPCFPGGQDTQSSELCLAAGCCWDSSSVYPLNLYYSRERNDHFSDTEACAACSGLDYVLLHSQGYVRQSPGQGLVALNLYWNPSPGSQQQLLRGASGDNVASTAALPPAQPGYTLARTEGYLGDPTLPPPPNSTLLRLWYSAAALDHWTTSSAADEAAAAAANYTLLGALGYALLAPPPARSNASTRCTAPSGPAASSDAYLFAHGTDYKAALADYVLVAGPVALPRRHWLGVSWSKWNESSTAADVLAQVAALEAQDWNVDSFIFDMQWHLKPGWGGYTWDSSRYPNVTALLAALHSSGLATGMNLHDADGVSAAENPALWPAFAAALGLPPTATSAPFAIGNRTYADALHAVVLQPLLQQGLDLCWTDFQQGVPGVAGIAGLVPTALLNHYRFYSCLPGGGGSSARGTQHSRYAGRGDHRHTSSFGGDVAETWESLVFMIDFTKTAANAPLCWWGHEMMRAGGGLNDASELFTRTNQFGAWSPIFTSWGNGGQNNDWWAMPEPFLSATRSALRLRTRLLPYRYTAAAAAAATGLCSHRGMHFAWPGEAEAYSTPGQFSLGEELVVAPAAAPVAGPPIPPSGGPGAYGSTPVALWVPPGDWRDFNSPRPATPLPSGWLTYEADIYTTPVLARGGAAIAMLPEAAAAGLGASARQYSALTWRIFPGAAAGASEVYEDDGASTDYLQGASAVTTLSYAAVGGGGGLRSGALALQVTNTTSGSGYSGMVRIGRAYALELLASDMPVGVAQNGVALVQGGSSSAPGTWTRSPDGATLIYLFLCSTDDVQSVQVQY